MKENGKIITCMDKEPILGVMVENIKESITWIKSMVTEFTIGLMVGDMKDIGHMGNNMEKENIFCLMV